MLAGTRKLDAGQRTTASRTLISELPTAHCLHVVLERARHLDAESSGAGFEGFYCVTQVRAGSETSRLVSDGDAPKWGQIFQFSIADIEADIVTVELHKRVSGAKDAVVGHVAVPASRIKGTGSEEGWYEIRARDGRLIMGSEGKASMLVRFRFL